VRPFGLAGGGTGQDGEIDECEAVIIHTRMAEHTGSRTMADDAPPNAMAIARATIAQIEGIERDAWFDLYEAAPVTLRATFGIAQRRLDDGVLLICRGLDNIQFNRLGYLSVSEAVHLETVDSAITAFDIMGVKNWIVHVAQGAEELARICAARGLTPHPRSWAKFLRDAKPAQAVLTEIEVREIDPDSAQVFGTTAAQGFGMPASTGDWLAAIVGRPRWRCFIGYEGETAVATGALYIDIDGDCGWFGIGATLPSHRKRGAQTALLAARINAAIASGCRLLTTETGIPHAGEARLSYANIQRAGFAVAYQRPNLHRG
jgi:GNAT superfamily N-acetyltransferase